jgi:hypothetical protein
VAEEREVQARVVAAREVVEELLQVMQAQDPMAEDIHQQHRVQPELRLLQVYNEA